MAIHIQAACSWATLAFPSLLVFPSSGWETLTEHSGLWDGVLNRSFPGLEFGGQGEDLTMPSMP